MLLQMIVYRNLFATADNRMRKFTTIITSILLSALLLAIFVPSLALAQSGDAYNANLTIIGETNPCGITGLSFWLSTCLVYWFANFLGIILWMLGWIIGIIGQIFTIFASFALSGAMFDSASIDEGWMIMRDIGNIAFIFILLYIGVTTILDIGGVNTNKLLARVVIAVLLMNFSLALTKIPIDASNVFAIAFHNAIGNGNARTDGFDLDIDSSLRNIDISGELMTAMSPQRLFTSVQIGADTVTSANFMETIMAVIVNSIFALVALGLLIYVFLTGIVIFLVRIVALSMVLIFSPAAVIAYAAGMDGFFKKWKTYLVNYAVVAPIYMFFIYLTLRFAKSPFLQKAFQDGFSGLGQGWGVASIAEWASGNAVFLVGYFMIIGFLQAGVKIAKQLGIVGADAIDKLGKKFAVVGKVAALATPLGAGMAAVSIAQKTLFNPAANIVKAGKLRTVDRGLKGVYNKLEASTKADQEAGTKRNIGTRLLRNYGMRGANAALGQTEDRIKESEKEFASVRSADELKLAISSPFISAEKAMAGMRVLAEKFKDFKPFGTFDPKNFEALYGRFKNIGVNTKSIEDVDPRFAKLGKSADKTPMEQVAESAKKRSNRERIQGYDQGIFGAADKDGVGDRAADAEKVGLAIAEGIVSSGKMENIITMQQHSAAGEKRLVEVLQSYVNEYHTKKGTTGDIIKDVKEALEEKGLGRVARGLENSNSIEVRALIQEKVEMKKVTGKNPGGAERTILDSVENSAL